MQFSYEFEAIESCECIGNFEDEYVYDIEMLDESHTFIANDILVHNSCYCSFEEVLEKCDWSEKYETGKDFILAFYKLEFSEYLNNKFEEYSSTRGTKNYLNFELENISASALFLAKKKYAYDMVWKDPGVSFESLSKVKFKGIEVIQTSTPIFARKALTDFTKKIFSQKKTLKVRDILAELKELKALFRMQNIEDISFGSKVNGLEKYIVDDNGPNLLIASGCQAHVRSAGYYNLLVKKSKWRLKYPLIKSGDKIKYYTTTDLKNNTFGYLAGQYPEEFAPPINYDVQFEKTIIDPLNRLIFPIVKTHIPQNLLVSKKLF